MKNREMRILEMLTDHNRLEVSEISERLGISGVTARKDLDRLEQAGIVKREHGYASLSTSNDIYARLAYHYDTKQLIAARAAELVSDGETVMIESGSCCALLAKELAETKTGVTIITNSAFIADFTRRYSTVSIVLLGGLYQRDSQVMVGPMLAQYASGLWVNRFFIGIDGYSEKTGFTNRDQLRAGAVKDMSVQADSLVVLTESQKFNTIGTVPMKISDKVSLVITDSGIPGERVTELGEKGIEVITI